MILATKRFALLGGPDVLAQLLDDTQTREYHIVIDKGIVSLRDMQSKQNRCKSVPESMKK